VGIRVALPKGRNFTDGYQALVAAGLALPSVEALKDSRVLLHKGPEVSVLALRNHDVPTYVDLGIADIGVVGKDVLLESGRDVYEPVDLGTGPCRLSVIRLPEAHGPIRRIATKYVNFTGKWLRSRGLSADIIELSGSVELAPITGLADAIVDLVATGQTLTANGLIETEVLAHSTARLIVNRQSLKLKRDLIYPLVVRLRQGF
jgi:ATP phosphoribosyltransferase